MRECLMTHRSSHTDKVSTFEQLSTVSLILYTLIPDHGVKYIWAEKSFRSGNLCWRKNIFAFPLFHCPIRNIYVMMCQFCWFLLSPTPQCHCSHSKLRQIQNHQYNSHNKKATIIGWQSAPTPHATLFTKKFAKNKAEDKMIWRESCHQKLINVLAVCIAYRICNTDGDKVDVDVETGWK